MSPTPFQPPPGGGLPRLDAPKTSLLLSGDRGSDNKNNVGSMLRHRLVVLVAGVLLAACATEPPVQEMSDARQAIMAAEDAGANEVARATLDQARRYIAEAEQQIRDEAYGPARANAVRAKNRALQALEAAEANDR